MSTNNIFLSFVIPAFNEEKYIGECLRSIYAIKNLPAFEVIVADNNSTDNTRELVAREFPSIKVVVEKTKKGPAAARNAGAKVASGELIAFIDSDCRVPEDWWNEVAAQFKKKPDMVLLFGPYRYYEVKSPLQKFIFYLSNDLNFQFFLFLGVHVLHMGGPGSGGDTVVKRKTFEKINGFNDDFEFYGEDIDLVKRMARQGPVRFASRVWVNSSNRRLKSEGVLKMWWIYSANTFSSIFFGKALHKKHRIIR